MLLCDARTEIVYAAMRMCGTEPAYGATTAPGQSQQPCGGRKGPRGGRIAAAYCSSTTRGLVAGTDMGEPVVLVSGTEMGVHFKLFQGLIRVLFSSTETGVHLYQGVILVLNSGTEKRRECTWGYPSTQFWYSEGSALIPGGHADERKGHAHPQVTCRTSLAYAAVLSAYAADLHACTTEIAYAGRTELSYAAVLPAYAADTHEYTRMGYAMCGTEIAYATSTEILYAASTEIAHAASTEIAYAASTEIAYAASTEIAYAASRVPSERNLIKVTCPISLPYHPSSILSYHPTSVLSPYAITLGVSYLLTLSTYGPATRCPVP
eukprot:3940511-Rhodomonas_salina.1